MSIQIRVFLDQLLFFQDYDTFFKVSTQYIYLFTYSEIKIKLWLKTMIDGGCLFLSWVPKETEFPKKENIPKRYRHPLANAFFVTGRKPRYVKFALCESQYSQKKLSKKYLFYSIKIQPQKFAQNETALRETAVAEGYLYLDFFKNSMNIYPFWIGNGFAIHFHGFLYKITFNLILWYIFFNILCFTY